MRLLPFLPRRWWSLRAWRAWRLYVRWRLETYGAYYPNHRLSRSGLRSLLRQFPSYFHWLGEMNRLRRQGARHL